MKRLLVDKKLNDGGNKKEKKSSSEREKNLKINPSSPSLMLKVGAIVKEKVRVKKYDYKNKAQTKELYKYFNSRQRSTFTIHHEG
jgi:hypothetical protein